MPSRFLHLLASDVPFIDPSALQHLIDSAAGIQAAEPARYAEMRKIFAPQAAHTADGIAVLRVSGTLGRRPHLFDLAYFGMEDTEAVQNAVEQVGLDRRARALVLDIDSPGGFFSGGPELAAAVREVSQSKPVVAWTGGMATSLAYMLASQADLVVATESAAVGSIGAMSVFVDSSERAKAHGVKVEVFTNSAGKFKGMGVPGTSLTSDQRNNLQESVERSFTIFRDIVAARRPRIEPESMQGQKFYGAEASSRHLVDAVGSLSYAISLARSRAS